MGVREPTEKYYGHSKIQAAATIRTAKVSTREGTFTQLTHIILPQEAKESFAFLNKIDRIVNVN